MFPLCPLSLYLRKHVTIILNILKSRIICLFYFIFLKFISCFDYKLLWYDVQSKIPVFLGGISIFVCFLSAVISLALAFAIVPRQVMPWTGLLLMYEWIFTIFILLFGSYLHFIFKWGKSMATQAGSFSDSESFDYSAKGLL